MSYPECPHGIVAGTCNWCMAESLEVEQKAIEQIRADVYSREQEEARARVADKRREVH